MIKKAFSHLGIFFLNIFSQLPYCVMFFISDILYYPFYYLIGYRKKVVRENLRNSFPEKTENERLKIEKEFFRYFLDLLMEILKMNSMSIKSLEKRIKLINFDLPISYLTNNSSIIISCGHFYNWEYIHFGLANYLPAEVQVIYKPLSNSDFDTWFGKVRARMGSVMIPMKQTMRMIANARKTTNVLCFAADQTPPRDKILYSLDFLHQKTPVFIGMEKIAIQTNRPVFYLDLKRIKRGHYEIHCIPLALNPAITKEHEITDKFYKLLEQSIHKHPANWLWSHRRWKHAY